MTLWVVMGGGREEAGPLELSDSRITHLFLGGLSVILANIS